MKIKLLLTEQGHWMIFGGHPGYPKKKTRSKDELSFFVDRPKIEVQNITDNSEETDESKENKSNKENRKTAPATRRKKRQKNKSK